VVANIFFSVSGTAVNCSAEGLTSFSCGKSVAVTAGAIVTGPLYSGGQKAAEILVSGAPAAWNAFGF